MLSVVATNREEFTFKLVALSCAKFVVPAPSAGSASVCAKDVDRSVSVKNSSGIAAAFAAAAIVKDSSVDVLSELKKLVSDCFAKKFVEARNTDLSVMSFFCIAEVTAISVDASIFGKGLV